MGARSALPAIIPAPLPVISIMGFGTRSLVERLGQAEVPKLLTYGTEEGAYAHLLDLQPAPSSVRCKRAAGANYRSGLAGHMRYRLRSSDSEVQGDGMARQLKFPVAAERSVKAPAALCRNERVVALYNQAHDTDAKRIAKNMRKWFVETAKKNGWDSAVFLPDVETRHSCGCVLYKSSSQTVQISVFLTGDDDG
jgi:hypothetical protein